MTRECYNVFHRDKPVCGFTLIELLVVVAIISLLMAILLPALHKARVITRRIACQSNLRQVTWAWHMYLDDNDGFFYQGINHNYDFGGWKGIGTSALHRPLNRYLDLPLEIETENGAEIFKCPADEGGGDYGPTAYVRFGNSYQANIMLIGPDQLPVGGFIAEPWKTLNQEINKHLKKLNRASLLEPAHLLLVGDHNWLAQWDPLIPLVPFGKSWHGKIHYHNLAFFDGHVDLVRIHKGLYVTPEYRVQPFKKLDSLVCQLQEEIQ